MEKITVLSLMSLTEAQLAKLRAVSPRLVVEQITGASFAELPPELQERVEILYGWDKPTDDAHRFPRLKWLQSHTAGVDYLLGKPLWHSEVMLTTTSGIHAVPMAEHALMLMLAFRWNLPAMQRGQFQAAWPEDRWLRFRRTELRGSTLGIVGYGAIGRELARQAQALGLLILAVNRSGTRSRYQGYVEPDTGDLEAAIPAEIFPMAGLLEMLPRCDYVIALTPLYAATRNLFGAAAFAQMKESAYFLNLGRGGLVDEPALVEALRRGQLAGAGLDVFAKEPLPPDHPFWAMENVIVSPHVSGSSLMYEERASSLFAENLRRYLAGEPLLNQVDRERGY